MTGYEYCILGGGMVGGLPRRSSPVRLWGDAEAAERVVYRGDVRSRSFSAWWLRENRVIAALVMNRPDVERERAPSWIQERGDVTARLLDDAHALA